MLAIVVLASGLYLWLKKRDVPFDEWLAGMQASQEEADAPREPSLASASPLVEVRRGRSHE